MVGFISGSWLLVLGILGAANLIIIKQSDAKVLIAKLSPFQGWIGAVSALWGLWSITNSVLNLSLLSVVPILWITLLASALVQFVLGFLLGFGVLKTFVKQPLAMAKLDEEVAILAPCQGRLGLVAIGIGVCLIVSSILWKT